MTTQAGSLLKQVPLHRLPTCQRLYIQADSLSAPPAASDQGEVADHRSGKGVAPRTAGQARLNIASNTSMMFTDMLLPTIPWNAGVGTLGGTTKRAGRIP